MSNTERTSRYGRNLPTEADIPAAPAANRKGTSGKQQLEAAITLPSAARLAATVLREPDLFACCCWSRDFIAFPGCFIGSVKPFQQRTAVLMLHCRFNAQFTVAVAQCCF